MGWHNPPVPWSELEAALSGRKPTPEVVRAIREGLPLRRQKAAVPPPPMPDREHVPYAELHCHSAFSFLDGAAAPDELVAEAVRLGLDAVAITDHDGFYGVVRFAEAAADAGMATIYGAELSFGLPE